MSLFSEIIKRFETQAPVCVMVRATMENVFAAERLDALFDKTAQSQENRRLMFSTVVDIMGLVACRIHPTVHAAYQAKKAEVGVTAKALYNKLQGVETDVSRNVVRETAARMSAIVTKTKGALPALLPGYRVKIVDGNHLRRTQRRLEVLRNDRAAPLPGHAAVVLDPRLKLVLDAIPCEDGHAQERTLLPALLETVERGDLWIADRNFCTTDFLLGIRARRAYFLIRQHAGTLRYELIGKRKRMGYSATGVVYEQAMRIFDAAGNAYTIRRITVELNEPTRDGEQEIHLLTNLPKKVTALRVADLYRERWTIETAFGEMAQNLQGEIETLGYPRAALFAFCMALVTFNILSVVQAAFRAAHGAEAVEDRVSSYYLCLEITGVYQGLILTTGDEYWTRYADMTPTQLAREMVRLAAGADLSRYPKHKRGPKKPRPKLKKTRPHVSTARLLAQDNVKSKKC